MLQNKGISENRRFSGVLLFTRASLRGGGVWKRGGIPYEGERYDVCMRGAESHRTVTQVRRAQHLLDGTVAMRGGQSVIVPIHATDTSLTSLRSSSTVHAHSAGGTPVPGSESQRKKCLAQSGTSLRYMRERHLYANKVKTGIRHFCLKRLKTRYTLVKRDRKLPACP